MLDMTEAFAPIPFSTPSPTRAAVLGAGAWGTALACALQRGGVQTTLWARRPEVVEAIRSLNRNPRHLPGIELPAGLAASTEIAPAVEGAQIVVLAVPSSAMRSTARAVAPLVAPGTAVLSAGKGIESETGALMTRVLEEELGPAVLTGSISGPSFAAEVASAKSTLLTLALPALERFHPQHKHARRIADHLVEQLSPIGVTLELTRDAVGAQVGGALKNMIAIACGMAIAQGMGENARAGIITRGLDDMQRLTRAMGGRVETLLGSSGVGDLFLTAASEHSRNTRLGMRLGKASTEPAGAAAELAEGAVSVMSVQVLERKYGLRLNVATAVRDVLQQRMSPERALQRLLHEAPAAARAPARAARSLTPRPVRRDAESRPGAHTWRLSYA